MKRIAAIAALVLAGSAGAAAPGEFVVCERERLGVWLSYVAPVEGFRPGENFIREFVRKVSENLPIVAVPVYFDRLRFNGDDAEHSWDYALDDGQTAAPADPQQDSVHVLGGRVTKGATGHLKSYWEIEKPTLMAHVACNDLARPEGDCRIDFDDARRSGVGEEATGPAVALFLDGGRPARVCVESVGIGSAEFTSWSLTLDGENLAAASEVCIEGEAAARFANAGEARISMVAAGDYRGGETLSQVLRGKDIAATLAFAEYLRRLAYQPSAERTEWLAKLVADSKAAFAKAGDTLRPCRTDEPPV